MNLNGKLLFLLIILFLVTFCCCKKTSISPFKHQEGIYIGSRHFQSYRYVYHYYPVAFDSITSEPTKFEEYYERIEIDTIFIDTARIEVFKDSILFDTYLLARFKFPIDEDNVYEISSYSAAGIELKHTISEDTFKVSHYYIIDKNSNYSGFGTNEFIGIKQ